MYFCMPAVTSRRNKISLNAIVSPNNRFQRAMIAHKGLKVSGPVAHDFNVEIEGTKKYSPPREVTKALGPLPMIGSWPDESSSASSERVGDLKYIRTMLLGYQRGQREEIVTRKTCLPNKP